MKMLDKVKGNNSIALAEIISKDYEVKYFNECKFIWENYVPKNGQSNCLQGELLREIEKIRFEAQDNGNINWDEDYSYFCDFINKKLCKQSIFSKKEKENISLILSYIKGCGIYAEKFNKGDINEKDIDVNKIAYVKDNLYNIITDAIGLFQKNNPNPIPYEINTNIKR